MSILVHRYEQGKVYWCQTGQTRIPIKELPRKGTSNECSSFVCVKHVKRIIWGVNLLIFKQLVTHYVDPRCWNVSLYSLKMTLYGLKHVGIRKVMIKWWRNTIWMHVAVFEHTLHFILISAFLVCKYFNVLNTRSVASEATVTLMCRLLLIARALVVNWWRCCGRWHQFVL